VVCIQEEVRIKLKKPALRREKPKMADRKAYAAKLLIKRVVP
jgi:hypothetical protein